MQKGELPEGEPACFRSIPNIDELRLLEISGANAAGAELDGLDGTVFDDLHILKIDLKGTLHILHHMHTDAACLLRQTAPGDATAIAADLAAECADFTHVYRILRVINQKNGGLTGTRTRDHRLKRAMLYRLSYQPAVIT